MKNHYLIRILAGVEGLGVFERCEYVETIEEARAVQIRAEKADGKRFKLVSFKILRPDGSLLVVRSYK